MAVMASILTLTTSAASGYNDSSHQLVPQNLDPALIDK